MGVSNSVVYDENDYMDKALAPARLAFKREVLAATWGHLAPVKNKKYRGYIVFSQTAYGDMDIIDSEFADLPDSPWFFDAMNNFVFSDNCLTSGAVYKFVGTFCNYRFDGERTVLYAPSNNGG